MLNFPIPSPVEGKSNLSSQLWEILVKDVIPTHEDEHLLGKIIRNSIRNRFMKYLYPYTEEMIDELLPDINLSIEKNIVKVCIIYKKGATSGSEMFLNTIAEMLQWIDRTWGIIEIQGVPKERWQQKAPWYLYQLPPEEKTIFDYPDSMPIEGKMGWWQRCWDILVKDTISEQENTSLFEMTIKKNIRDWCVNHLRHRTEEEINERLPEINLSMDKNKIKACLVYKMEESQLERDIRVRSLWAVLEWFERKYSILEIQGIARETWQKEALWHFPPPIWERQ